MLFQLFLDWMALTAIGNVLYNGYEVIAMKHKWSKEDTDLLVNKYATSSVEDLAKEIGVSISALYHKANRLGLRKEKRIITASGLEGLRKGGLKNRKYFYNERFFQEPLNEISAYWLGFIQADGHIRTDSRGSYLEIDISKEDVSLLYKFAKDIGSDSSIVKVSNTRNSASISVCRRSMVDDLIRLGVAYDKTFADDFPRPIEHVHHYIRGIFDGDGSIWFHKSGNPYMSICGTKKFCEWCLNEIRKGAGITGGYVAKHRSIARLFIGGRYQIHKVFKWLYKNATRYLERKKQVFEKNESKIKCEPITETDVKTMLQLKETKTYKEIGKIYGLSANAVFKRIKRYRQKGGLSDG